jgi:hypothetical protein
MLIHDRGLLDPIQSIPEECVSETWIRFPAPAKHASRTGALNASEKCKPTFGFVAVESSSNIEAAEWFR